MHFLWMQNCATDAQDKATNAVSEADFSPHAELRL